MPFYRVNGMDVHMKGTKLPQPCGARVWNQGQEQLCRAISAFLCDFPDGGGHTCDRALCEAHAHQAGRNRHYCPTHKADAIAANPQRGLFTQLLDGGLA
jgi:hypothetical protein